MQHRHSLDVESKPSPCTLRLLYAPDGGLGRLIDVVKKHLCFTEPMWEEETVLPCYQDNQEFGQSFEHTTRSQMQSTGYGATMD